MKPIDCTETSVRNDHYSLRNSPEERSSHEFRGGSLKSRKAEQHSWLKRVKEGALTTHFSRCDVPLNDRRLQKVSNGHKGKGCVAVSKGGTVDTPKLWRRRIYRVSHTMAVAAAPVRPIRIVTLHPNHDWTRTWRNLTIVWIPDVIRSTWYMAIHDIQPPRSVLTGLPFLQMTVVPTADRLTPCRTV